MKLIQKILKLPLLVKIFLVVFLIIVAFIGYRKYRISQSAAPIYQTAKAEKGTVVSGISASGNVVSTNFIEVNTQASGVVKTVFVKDGNQVSKGTKIAEITLDLTGQQRQASAWSGYLSAKNSLESTKINQLKLQSQMFTNWDEFKLLAESDTYENPDGSPKYNERALAEFHIAEKDWLASEAEYKNQQNVIVQAQAALNNTWLAYKQSSQVITAPIAGKVSNVGLVEGMIVNAGGSQSNSTSNTTSNSSSALRAAVIQNSGKTIVSADLTEVDVNKVAVGQKATVTFDSLADKTFTGTVVTVDKIGTVSNNVTNYPINIQLDTQSEEILPNMAVNATIIIDSKSDVLTAPSSAVQTANGQEIVRVLRNGKVEEIEVETGISSETDTEIISGLKEGDEVITSSQNGQTTQTGTQQRSVFSTGFGGGFMRR